MRIRRRTEFTVTDGPVAIVDPSYVFNSIPDFPFVSLPAISVCFDNFGGKPGLRAHFEVTFSVRAR